MRKDSVTLVLTFDDGPHLGGAGSPSLTREVLRVLQSNPTQPGIAAAFFVITSTPSAMAHPAGLAIVQEIHRSGHVLGIHSGSLLGHVEHPQREREPPDRDASGQPMGSCGLESDLIRAREALRAALGEDPAYVRATYGSRNARCIELYRKHHLRHIWTDAELCDNGCYRDGQRHGPASPSEARAFLQADLLAALAAGRRELILMLHDPNPATVSHLAEYIAAAAALVTDAGFQPHFTTTAHEIRQVFARRDDDESRP